MSNLTKAFDEVFATLRPGHYASEEETAALLVPDTRSSAELQLHYMMDERGAWEQGTDAFPILRDIALELLTEQKRTPAQQAPAQSCYCPNCEALGKELVAIKAPPALVPVPDYAWPTIADYEKDAGFPVSQGFKAAWNMARTTNSFLNQLAGVTPTQSPKNHGDI